MSHDNHGDHLPILRDALRQIYETGSRNWSEVSEEIEARTGAIIDRRRLQRIVEAGEDVRLRLSEIRSLDRYLRSKGIKFIAAPSLLEELVAPGRILFYFGVYPRDDVHRTDISVWDVRSFRALLNGVNSLRVLVAAETVEVPPESTGTPPAPADCSTIFVGSPRANVSSLDVLRRMFPPSSEVPFSIYWLGDTQPTEPGKAIVTSRSEFPDYAKSAGGGPQATVYAAIHLHGTMQSYYESTALPRSPRYTYGIIAFQRRTQGLAIVLAGLTGPGTYACARAIDKFPLLQECIPPRPAAPSQGGALAPTGWALVRARVHEPGGHGDYREIKDEEIELLKAYAPTEKTGVWVDATQDRAKRGSA